MRLISRLMATIVAIGFVQPTFATYYPKLEDSRDFALQQQLRGMIEAQGLERAVRDGRLGLSLVDITDPENPRVAEANGNRMYYAASLPKIAILLGAFQAAADGRMDMNYATRKELGRMIRVSSNSAASNMLERVGMPYLADVLQCERYGFYDRYNGGGLWVGKLYAKKGVWKRDPLRNLSHAATTMQVARFLYMMETGRLVSPEASRDMKELMGNPGIAHKFVKGLAQRPGSRIFRKSGSWSKYHADGAIIERNGRRYIAVGLVADKRGGKWLSDLIVGMDDIIMAGDDSMFAAW